MTDFRDKVQKLIREMMEKGSRPLIVPGSPHVHHGIMEEIAGEGNVASVDPKTLEPGTAIVVCIEATDPLRLPDNLTASCAYGCGKTLQHRPHYPDNIAKVCVDCALERATHTN